MAGTQYILRHALAGEGLGADGDNFAQVGEIVDADALRSAGASIKRLKRLGTIEEPSTRELREWEAAQEALAALEELDEDEGEDSEDAGDLGAATGTPATAAVAKATRTRAARKAAAATGVQSLIPNPADTADPLKQGVDTSGNQSQEQTEEERLHAQEEARKAAGGQ